MKRLLIITSCLFICIACFAGNAKDSTIVTYILPIDNQNKNSVRIYLSEVYRNNKKYVYGALGNHGGKNPDYFKTYVWNIQDTLKFKKLIDVKRDDIGGPYVFIKSPCSFDTIRVIFPFEENTGAKTNDFLYLNIIIKNYSQQDSGTKGNAPPLKPTGIESFWEKIKSSYSPYWIIILIDWLVILCIVGLIVCLFCIRNKKTVKEQSDGTQEKVKDEDKKEKGKQSRSQKEDNRDVQLEGFKNLIINEMKDVVASQKSEFASLKTELLSKLSNLKEQIQINQNNADKTNSSPNRTIVSSQSVSGIGTNPTNELDTREVDFQDGKMVIVKDSQYKYFRIFSEKGSFYYTQNPEYGIETWASDYNNLTDAMTIKNPYDSQNSRNIKIVERGKLTKVSDDTFEIAEKLVLEFI